MPTENLMKTNRRRAAPKLSVVTESTRQAAPRDPELDEAAQEPVDLFTSIKQAADELSGFADRIAKVTSHVISAGIEFDGGDPEAEPDLFFETMRGRIDRLACVVQGLENAVFGFRS